jgi:4-amino-4-deoxychorismate lyase
MASVREDLLSVTDSPDFYIFTSYLWGNQEHSDPAIGYGNHYFLPYHRDRLFSAAQAFGWHEVASILDGDAGLRELSNVVEKHLNAEFDRDEVKATKKVKVCIYKDTRFHVESTNISPADPQCVFPLPATLNEITSPARLCIVKLDTESTMASSFTSHKTSERIQYDRARKRAAVVHEPPTIAEVLLINTENEVMECSLSTPYFLRDGRWVTPPLSSGGNAGVTRRLALEADLCEEHVVYVDGLSLGEAIWISNGVRGFIPTTLCLEGSL